MMQGVLSSIQVVISLFSTLFALISAYIAGLYFFLRRAPLPLKLLAFLLLSIGLIFLGGAAITQQRLQVGLLNVWAKLPTPVIVVDGVLRNPIPVALPPGWTFYDVGVMVGWLTAVCVYLALAPFLSFCFAQNTQHSSPGECAAVESFVVAEWAALEHHFRHHATLVNRFRRANGSAVLSMWMTQTNEAGKRLSQFERHALIERHCELFGTWPQ
jgi:hypothetical protein